ncbi:hypothetical protein CkaCkLH20_09204 [Colletotrichum karsti]|uniref:Uncharacterized protein n=1 Tax=Colletotrichum karsti TaxID=1095194 RepID=A0A9P6LHP7_9PEZI|nr:uncharacterized protein CkaCkLH20_09204 [Colletotrichum karsti]KAF9873391.1 hypothetical protein CkaCkLH20_09204 [Colletotrichum karsti]
MNIIEARIFGMEVAIGVKNATKAVIAAGVKGAIEVRSAFEWKRRSHMVMCGERPGALEAVPAESPGEDVSDDIRPESMSLKKADFVKSRRARDATAAGGASNVRYGVTRRFRD